MWITGTVLLVSNMSENTIELLDVRGLCCPLPLLKAKQKLASLVSGEQLKVLATDPGSKRDFSVFIELSEYEMLESLEEDGIFSYLIQK